MIVQFSLRVRRILSSVPPVLMAGVWTGCDQASTPTAPATPPPAVFAQAASASGDDLVNAEFPAFDVEVEEVDLCEAIEGLCGALSCPDESVVGPSSAKKGIGWKLTGCGNLTKLRIVSGQLAMEGALKLADVRVNPGTAAFDLGCREDVFTIPAVPAIPAIPAIIHPLTGRVIFPGRPGVPGRPARTFTVRTPPGCQDPLRPPSADFTPPSLSDFAANVRMRVRGDLVVEAAGRGQVELRIPIPGAGIKKRLPAGIALQHPHLIKVGAKLHLYLKGALSEAGARFTTQVNEEAETDYVLSPTTGWTTERRALSTNKTAEVETVAPDTATLVWGLLPAAAFTLAPVLRPDYFPAGLSNNAFFVEFGLWDLNYFRHTFSQISSGALKVDTDAGVEAGVYAGAYHFKQDMDQFQEDLEACEATDVRCRFSTIPVDTIGGEFFRTTGCCEVDLYDQYGTGQFRFAATTTGDAIDLDPDGYLLAWSRPTKTPEPWVDTVLTRAIAPNDLVYYPERIADTPSCDGEDCDPPPSLPTRAFGVIPRTRCAQIYSDALIEIHRLHWRLVIHPLTRMSYIPGPPPFTAVVGCEQLPADYSLLVSGLAENCAVAGDNPRAVRLRPLLNLPRRVELPRGIGWADVLDVTDVDLAIHCRPLVGNLRVAAGTEGEDADRDGYTLTVDDAVKGQVSGRVGANDQSALEALRVGGHTLSVGDVAFNCALGSPAEREVDIRFEQTADHGVTVHCVSVYDALCEVVRGMRADGSINHRAVALSLCVKLRAADLARERGSRTAPEWILRAFTYEVRALTGKRISEPAAARLLEHAAFIEANGFYLP